MEELADRTTKIVAAAKTFEVGPELQRSKVFDVRPLAGTSLKYEHSQSPVRFLGRPVRPDRFVAATGEGKGFEVVVPAHGAEQVLDLWIGAIGGTALIEASVTGGAAHFYTDTSHSSSAKLEARRYTLNFTAARSNERLRVKVRVMTQSGKAKAAVVLFAAALSSAEGNQGPSVRVVSPEPYATFQAPAQIRLEAEASDADGQISKVEFYDFSLAIKLGEALTPPFQLTIPRASAWSGSFCARAYDNHGRAIDSKPVRYQVEDAATGKIAVTPPILSSFVSSGLPNAGFEGVSSLVELPSGDIYAAWYAGKYELSPDSAIYSAILRKGSAEWTTPHVIVDEPNVAEGNVVMLWRDDVLWCFYVKVYGNAREFSRLFYRKSQDEGVTWGSETAMGQPEFRYPTGTLVSTRPLSLRNGTILLPVNRESYNPDRGKQWYSLFLLSADNGKTWVETKPIYSMPGNIQPTVVQLADDSLLALLRVRGSWKSLWRSR